jgi:DNA-binding transcriptional MocR family regulator
MARSRYKTLVDAIAADIRSGRLAPGTRLPTHRALSKREGLALVTASRVYAELEAMGLVSGEAGRGTFVRETTLPPGLGVDQHALGNGIVDLNFNYPLLPDQTELLRAALRQLALAGDLEALLRYQPHAGRAHERAAAARHLCRAGLSVAEAQVLIVSGAQHGLAITLMTLLHPGDVIAVDTLSYSGFKLLASTLRLEMVAIAAGQNGPDLDALERLCRARPVRAIYTMPTLHNPLGWVMPLAERQRLVAIARMHDVHIIEDAAYAYLVEDAPAPIAQLAPERTFYVTGISKSVATGLRVGFLTAPLLWVSQLERTIRATTWNTPGVLTAIVTGWLEDGTVVRLEAEKRREAQARQQLSRQVLGDLHPVAHRSSYFVWLPLAEEARADQIAAALLHEGIVVSTAEPFCMSPHVPHALRLALGSVSLCDLEKALWRVRFLVEAHT